MKPGDRVIVSSKTHPHHGESGELLEYGPYGLSFLNLKGWKVRLDDGYYEFYAKESELTQEGTRP